ncbi:protein penguin [Daktulosphaira vitifoliae]|uniref:protein penguin n=1 Tax=Daktulosphaira vitifoliae TaxID=58002 RepID=UPI0021AA50C8|nr:protein penguin [Daktulosphaira vitifoliae]XP_050528828.1 protein penguin [Daktulosphaira vitifoliae]
MAIKRLSTKDINHKEKMLKVDHELTTDYTEVLTCGDIEFVESGNDNHLSEDEKKAVKKDNNQPNDKLQVSKNKIKGVKESKIKNPKGKLNNTKDKPTEKPNWKEFKKEKQELRVKRKQQKCPFYETIIKAKQHWENVRRDDCPKDKKETLLKELLKFSKPHLEPMVYSHDTSRIVQWMIKLGTPEIRTVVINELLKHVPKMLLSKYASLCVKNMFKQGNAEQRKLMINSVKGKVYALTLRTNAAKIMDLIYTTYATPEQQNSMMHELYGASNILCESTNVQSFSDILKNSPNTKDIILAKTKDHIKKFVLKQKNSMQTTLVHNLIYEYLLYVGVKECGEIFSSLREFPFEHFYTSKSGCHIAMYLLWTSSPKEKKAILKHIKSTGAILDLATMEYGHLILLALFDSVDDTVLVKKTIIPEILNNIDNIATNEYGRRVILYLVSWRDSSYFHPNDIEQLKKGDSIKDCKKEDEVRVKELLNAVSERLLKHVQETPSFWLNNGSIAMVLLGILKSGNGETLEAAMKTVADYIVDPNNQITDKDKQVPVYEHAGLHMMLRKLIGHDQVLADSEKSSFSEILSLALTQETLKTWMQCNRACFLIVSLLESKVNSAIKNIKTLMKTDIMKLLNSQHFSGAKVLITKMKSKD